MVGGRACYIHRNRLIIAPPGFETVTQRRINTGAYGNLIPLKIATKVELTVKLQAYLSSLPQHTVTMPCGYIDLVCQQCPVVRTMRNPTELEETGSD